LSISNNAVIDSRMDGNDAGVRMKKPQLRAHREHIEGVGLRCTWIEEPESEFSGTREGEADDQAEGKATARPTAPTAPNPMRA